MTVKCKNLMQYDLAFSIPEGGGVANVTYDSTPSELQGGATIPVAFFRDPKVEDLLPGDKAGQQRLLGYKSLHYEHMREFIQKQELLGN